MEIEILGPLRVRVAGIPVTPSAAKPCTLLATLALHAGESVPIAALFSELWGNTIPRSASTTLQTYVMHLRNLIGAALDRTGDTTRVPKGIVVTQPGGYLLDIGDGRMDVWEFQKLATAGHRAREAGDFQKASAKFGEALAMWRGGALSNVQLGPMTEIEACRLEEARFNVLERRIDADLRLGRHHELLAELSALVARHPTHEGLAAQQMLALYRAGRRAESLSVYRQLRTRLVNGLGMEPSPVLQVLHRGVLVSDRHLAEPRAGVGAVRR
ncbi:BTAD domain-containing putative transcriptional regulator [Microbispora sp. NPDC049125]|uniref:AfsR/SARP family transcriptional regulator n=1 Tax=Microbispora sp. NPDC049125 TaxID=3154929 RepID=UPI0034663031